MHIHIHIHNWGARGYTHNVGQVKINVGPAE
jgi:hypothetical protein